ncbi:hypothetical protein PVAG01_04369 [Phlyctema vagabunda]|uniref:Uncharacterized protein n=1 Tax=Phlyctema vagabunda TaxID=108571 RepID=A0ABR4PNZ6_9HELO
MLTPMLRHSCLAVAAIFFGFAALVVSESHTSSGGSPKPSDQGVVFLCDNRDGPFAPFCKPENGSTLYVGETYHVTWDSSFYAESQGINSTILIMASHSTVSGDVAKSPSSPITPNRLGFLRWTLTSAWLKNSSSNDVTLFIVPLNAAEGTDNRMVRGPTIKVLASPKSRPKQAGGSSHRALSIALPVVVGISLLFIGIGYYIHRKKGLRSTMGREAGYGVGKSRSQRVGNEDRTAIQLEEQTTYVKGTQKQPI